MKAFIVGGNRELAKFLPEVEIVDNFKDAKIVIFGDGPIVSPSLYKEKKTSGINLKCDINRDRSDKAIYVKLKPDQIAVGIGRGACFLAVMNGAKIVQQVVRQNISESSYPVEFKFDGKTYTFSAISNWEQSIDLSSCDDYDLLGKSKTSTDYIAKDEIKRFMRVNGDPELIKFHKENAPTSICIQFHPEWIPESYISKLTKEIIYECANS